MTPIIVYSKGNIISILKIEMLFVYKNVLAGSKETILEHVVPKLIENILTKNNGPIEVFPPTIEDEFDYLVYLDLRCEFSGKQANKQSYSSLGIIFFCSANDFNLKFIKDSALNFPNWSNAPRHSLEDLY